MNLSRIPQTTEFRQQNQPVFPKLWSWVEPRKYEVPAGFPSPKPLAGTAFAACFAPDDLDEDRTTSLPFHYIVQWHLSQHGVPTMLVPKELAQALYRTRVPRDLALDRLKFPFPAVRFLFEDGSIPFSNGHLKFLQFAAPRANTLFSVPAWTEDRPGQIEAMRTAAVGEDELVVISTFHMKGSRFAFDGRDVATHFPISACRTLGDLLDAASSDEPTAGFEASYLPPMSDELPETLPLLINLLLFMAAKPEMVEAETEVRAPRVKHNKQREGIYVPRKLGFKFRLASTVKLTPAEAAGRKLAPGWRCGHWKDQPYGPNSTLRREIWIEPYAYGRGPAEPSA
jgi:hypothetical protein